MDVTVQKILTPYVHERKSYEQMLNVVQQRAHENKEANPETSKTWRIVLNSLAFNLASLKRVYESNTDRGNIH
jgi:hypothetical protein